MGSLNFLKYLNKFESEVICKGVVRKSIGKKMIVNVREGRFACTRYARQIGERVDSDVPFVLDYYGYQKRSQGFIDLIRDKKKSITNRQIKSIQTRVVFFASLKIEEIAELTSNQYLRSGFSEFKKMILHWRGFEKRKKKTRERSIEKEDRRVTM